jgi:peptidoglycan/xylan/chitin deacetylase (PgdA/CDA1 family)
MKYRSIFYPGLIAISFFFYLESCQDSQEKKSAETNSHPSTVATSTVATEKSQPATDAATIMSRKQVPILCYHHIRNVSQQQLKNVYEVSADEFRQQMKLLSDSGYHSITPDQLYNYLTTGAALPAKPVMLTFDDTDEEQFTIGKTEMDKYGFKGVYFIMNISIGRPRYMTKEMIKQLADEGHTICSHTYDHRRVDRYKDQDTIDYFGGKKMKVNDWDFEITEPRKKLETIIGKPVDYFAYPYGIWKPSVIPEIKKRGIKLAFQLSEKRDSTEPLYTVRRMIVASSWSPEGVLKVMRSTFK